MIKSTLYNFFGKIYIPDSFDYNANYLLHISDTPSSIFASLNTFIKKVQPKVIIHTGDLVDNIKLEIYPSSLDGYNRYLRRLIRILEVGDRDVYYTLGNHDNAASIIKYTHKGTLIKTYEEVTYGAFTFGMVHNIEDNNCEHATHILFGHNLELCSDYLGSVKYFNGIEKIVLLNLDTGQIIPFDYPRGTTESRLLIYRKGL